METFHNHLHLTENDLLLPLFYLFYQSERVEEFERLLFYLYASPMFNTYCFLCSKQNLRISLIFKNEQFEFKFFITKTYKYKYR